jgi:Recombination endonuclease VII
MATSEQTSVDKAKKAQAKYRKTEKYKISMRNSRYKRIYGITLDEYNQMLEEQNFVCKICHCPETSIGFGGEVKSLAIDHCHDTGKVRGLLCDRCNHLLGLAKDSTKVLQNCIKYLKDLL